jgi:hypothetical protein
MAAAQAAKTSRARKPKANGNGDATPEEIEAKVAAEQEQKRLDALKDDSRKVGPNGGSMKRESSTPKKPRASAFLAAEKVLRDATGPMSVDDILAEVKRRKLYTFSDAPTPPKTRMYVQLHAGIAKGKTVKVGRGMFDLADLNPKGAEKRPKK